MSKAVHSPLGQWRGRTGGQVYRVSHGQQIVSAYQPKVANPRTDNQQKQRAKFNLMTRLNAITPSVLLRPFSPTAGIARPMFSKSLMKYIEVDTTTSLIGETVYTAKIAAQNIHFGEGDVLFPADVTMGVDILVASTPTGVSVEVAQLVFSGDVVAVRAIDVCRTVGEGGKYVDVRYHDFTTDDAGAPYEFMGDGMQHRIYFQFIHRRGSLSSLRTGAITDEGEDSTDIIAGSDQLVNSNNIVGSSMYYSSMWIPAQP